MAIAGHVVSLGVKLQLLDSGVRRDAGTLYVLYPEPRWRTALWQANSSSVVLGVAAGLASARACLRRLCSQRLGRPVRSWNGKRADCRRRFQPDAASAATTALRNLSRSVNDMARPTGEIAGYRA